MREKIKKINIIMILVTFLVVICVVTTVIYVKKEKDKTYEIEATVKLIGDNYIIVEDNNGEKYSLKTEEEHKIGDRVDFIIKNIKKDSDPKEGTILKIDTISKEINFYIKDNSDNNNNDNNSTNDNQTTKPENLVDNTNTQGTEADVISFFSDIDNKLDNYTQDKNLGDTVKKGFVTIVDFLFYEGEIKGKTFDELSTTSKIKVLQIAFSIDEKIEKYFPGYKDTISKTGKKIYTNVKTKAIELYLDITTKVCTNDPDTCTAAKQGLTDLKESFSLTWDFIKNISNIGLTKLKNWYEVWRSC